MDSRSLVRTLFLLASALLFGAAFSAHAATRPPLRILVPYPPGGAVDAIARVMSPKLSADLDQSIIIMNRPGASGIIATDALISSPADGNTIIIVISSHAVNPALYKKLPYDTSRDFAPITLLGTGPNVLTVSASSPIHTLNDLINTARPQPDRITFADFGNGSSSHLSGELLNIMANVKLVPVPYQGAAPAVKDVLGGQIPMMFGNLPVSLPFINNGSLRAVAVTSAKRASSLPQIPTFAESGLPGYETGEWWGVLARAGTSKPDIDRLNKAMIDALADPDIRKKLVGLGVEPVGSSAQQFQDFITQQIAKWGDVIHKAGITLQ